MLLAAFENVCGSASPALENMIHGTFAITHVLGSDKTARAAEQLVGALSGFNEAAGRCCTSWVAAMTTQAKRAIAEGDLREDVDAQALSEAVVGAMFGTRMLAIAMTCGRAGEGLAKELNAQLSQIWMLLLPGVAAEASLPYFRQYLAREVMRQHRAVETAPVSGPVAVPDGG